MVVSSLNPHLPHVHGERQPPPSPQLTNLRRFQPHFTSPSATTSRRRNSRLGSQATDIETLGSGLDILQNAQPFQPSLLAAQTHFTSDTNGNLPSFPGPEHWHDYPELFQGCEPTKAPLKVAVLLSGGVDSSLALHLLHAAGHEITAFYLQIWFQEDFRNFWDACPWEEDLSYCEAVCDSIGVPLKMIPLSNEYWERVVSFSVAEIKAGRTPNPDMLCNSRVKFGAFLEYLEGQNEEARFDRIASGHYARIERHTSATTNGSFAGTSGMTIHSIENHKDCGDKHEDNNNTSSGTAPYNTTHTARLCLTPDAIKDQTYFLAHLTQAQLSKVMFPLGYLTKSQVRSLARAAGLPNQDRKDSQGICFLGKVKFSEFVKEHLGEWPGPLIEEETNEVVGYHRGFWFHTVGQRKGIFLSGGPWYVTRKDPNTNTVYVSRQYYEGDTAVSKNRSSFTCGPFNWTGDVRIDDSEPLYVKVRHGPKLYECTLTPLTHNNNDSSSITVRDDITDSSTFTTSNSDFGYVELNGVDQGLSAGQYAVFYQHGYCLGCAVICS